MKRRRKEEGESPEISGWKTRLFHLQEILLLLHPSSSAERMTERENLSLPLPFAILFFRAHVPLLPTKPLGTVQLYPDVKFTNSARKKGCELINNGRILCSNGVFFCKFIPFFLHSSASCGIERWRRRRRGRPKKTPKLSWFWVSASALADCVGGSGNMTGKAAFFFV